jgi:hypothetical protein
MQCPRPRDTYLFIKCSQGPGIEYMYVDFIARGVAGQNNTNLITDHFTAGTAILTSRDGSGGHHAHHTAPSTSTYSQSSCSPPVDSAKLLTAVADLDYQLHTTLKQLPEAITDAK